jgi:N-hydroxyarylamine O-acetyltransferase
VLSALGFQVRAIRARVRIHRPRDFIPPRTHVFLRVELGRESWLTDVGVGALSLTAAIRLEADVEQATPHELRRVVRQDTSWFHQAWFADTWHDICEFTLEEMPAIDRELGNWFTSTHPDSHFKNRLLVARADSEGKRVTLLNDELTERHADGRPATRRIGSRGELLEILASHFGLELPADTRFPLLDSVWPAQ